MADTDEYACVARSRLSLKADSGITKKKKKRKSAGPEITKNTSAGGDSATANSEPRAKPVEPKRTPAEIAFQKMQEKMQKERIAQKASMTHKQRVEKFNQHLDSLTEHFDIPKVSWTK